MHAKVVLPRTKNIGHLILNKGNVSCGIDDEYQLISTIEGYFTAGTYLELWVQIRGNKVDVSVKITRTLIQHIHGKLNRLDNLAISLSVLLQVILMRNISINTSPHVLESNSNVAMAEMKGSMT
jgi:hypothetical protein